MYNLKTEEVKKVISKLANNLRAEKFNYNNYNYFDLYSGIENINFINNNNNNIVYGRRGSGKTHLLKALQQKVLDDFDSDRNFPIYVDLRRIIPLISSENGLNEVDAILIFKYLIQEVSHTLSVNSHFIFGINDLDPLSKPIIQEKEKILNKILSKIYLEFDGKHFTKPSTLSVSEEEVRSVGGGVQLSNKPELKAEGQLQKKTSGTTNKSTYISILDITNEIERIIDFLSLNGITIILDEWSEVEQSTQLYLSEIIKKSFSAINVSVKLAAIPNRTNLGIRTDQKFFGLEDGGDIFGYQLDMRYVFEVNKTQTRNFFNDLLYRHLSAIDKQVVDKLIKDNKTTKDKLINIFFANVGLNEILIACAGVPRDFINLFINSYDRFILSSNEKAKRISVRNLRAANSAWYETDKKEQVDKHDIERQLLADIVAEVIEKKKSTHFLVPEKYTNNKHIQNLIDFRVMHLRKKGYSHKDHPGMSYNVYSIDYGCYNSINITKNNLSSSTLDKLNFKELSEIRRISLEDKFFQKFLMDIGEAFSCPLCSKPIDTNHPAYIKQSLCNNCFEKVDKNL